MSRVELLLALGALLVGSCADGAANTSAASPPPEAWRASALSRGQVLSLYQTAGPPERHRFWVRNGSRAPLSELVVTVRWSAGELSSQRLGPGRELWTDQLPHAPDGIPLSISVLETTVSSGSVVWVLR